ncbi:MAG: META domain-containing protein [Leptolyngbyaceae cyanobacterium]
MKNVLYKWASRSLSFVVLIGVSTSAIAATPKAGLMTTSPNPKAEALPTMANLLEETPWQLTSYRDASGELIAAVTESPAIFEFQAGRLSGTTGCNRFFSAYTLTDKQLEIAPGGSTLMACFPESLSQQESTIFSQFSNVVGYEPSASGVSLVDADGRPLFVLSPLPQATLTETVWTLTSYNNGQGGMVTTLPQTTITAVFDETGRVSGSAGCNNYHANFEQTEATLSIGAAASTRRLCGQAEGVMEQESTFLALLAEVDSYSIFFDQLVLKNAEGTALFRFLSS